MRTQGAAMMLVLWLPALLVAGSCGALGAAPFKLLGWSPGGDPAPGSAPFTLRLDFSMVPDTASVENAFSLSENGAPVAGEFLWDGASVNFIPYCGWSPQADYRLAVSGEARTADGLSLEPPFEVSFSTKVDKDRPRVDSTVPERGGIVLEGNSNITVKFSEPIDPALFPESVSFSPGARGRWTFDSSGTVATFTPMRAWEQGTEYEVRLSADVRDLCGNTMAEPYSFRFICGDDRVAPELLALEAIDAAGAAVLTLRQSSREDGTVLYNNGWETGWRLRASFSEDVVLSSVDTQVQCSSGLSLRRLTGGDCARVVEFSLKPAPEWGSVFYVDFSPGIRDAGANQTAEGLSCTIVADGPRSKPPRLLGLRIPLAPGMIQPADRCLSAFSVDRPYETIAITSDQGHFPVGIQTALVFECYFELAPGASIDILSLMDTFRARATNGALDFSAVAIRPGGLDYAAPCPEWPGAAIALIEGSLTNRAASGVFTVQFASGLVDSLGNVNHMAQTLALLK